MIPDRLYELAFKFRKIKLWERLYDSQLFAVRHSDGSLGYCCVMGTLGEHLALAVYPDIAGLEAYRRMYTEREGLRLWEVRELAFSQNCAMCSFESKSDLEPRERDEAGDFCRRHGVKPAGKNAYPRFQHFLPQHHPWFLTDETAQTHLAEALEACLEINDRLVLTPPEAVGFTEGLPYDRSIPLLEKGENGYTWSRHPLPAPLPERYPSFPADDDITQKALARARKSDALWACEVVMSAEAMADEWDGDEPVDAPCYPYVAIVIDVESGIGLSADCSSTLEECAMALGRKLVELAGENGIPKSVYVLSSRTREMIAPLCRRMGAKLSVRKRVPLLEDTIEYIMQSDEEDEEEEEIDEETLLRALEDSEAMARIPDSMLRLMKQNAEMGALPRAAAPLFQKEIDRRALQKGQKDPEKGTNLVRKRGEGQSCVISVSLEKGCYRHIQINGGDTLADLSDAILDAFGFDNDHLHAFFMDNHAWSDQDAYYADGMDDDDTSYTSDAILDEMELYEGRPFKYVFDFGDDWRFQCKVLKWKDEVVDEPRVIRSVGEAPQQYGDWEDDWDDE